MVKKIILMLILASAWFTPAGAEDRNTDPERLRVTVEPYIWAPQISGTVIGDGVRQKVKFDASDWADMADEIEFILYGRLEVSKGRFAFLYDVTYLDLEDDASRTADDQPLDPNIPLKSRHALQEWALAYQIGKWNTGARADKPLTLDVLAGARHTYLHDVANTAFILNVPITGQFIQTDENGITIEWVDPFVGFRTRYDLSGRVTLSLRADAGGFGAASDFAWNVFVDARYYFTRVKDGFIAAGVRGYGDHFSKEGFAQDLVGYGPVLSAGFVF